MRKTLLFIGMLLLTITLVACSNTGKEFDFEQTYITVGLEADYEPYNWKELKDNDYNYPLHNKPGEFVAGYDVEVAKHVANELGLDLRIVQIPWEGLINSLRHNDIDLVIAGMSPTEKRSRQILFSDSYFESKHVVVALKDGEYSNITTLDELEGAKGVGQMETTYAASVDYVVENFGAIKHAERDTIPEIVQNLIGKTADFTVVEEPVAQSMIAKFPEQLKIVINSDENIFNLSYEDRNIAIGLRKNDNILRDKVNDALKSVTQAQKNQWMSDAVERAE